MKLFVFALLKAALIVLVTAHDSYLFCVSKDCGQASGLFSKPKQTWNLSPGEYSTEMVPASSCFLGHVKGFKASVCILGTYPSLECMNENSIFVQKNGSPYGTIEVTPYCTPL